VLIYGNKLGKGKYHAFEVVPKVFQIKESVLNLYKMWISSVWN